MATSVLVKLVKQFLIVSPVTGHGRLIGRILTLVKIWRLSCLFPCSESTYPCYTWLVKCSAFGSWATFHFQEVVFQFHRFHSLQVVDYLPLASETAVSLRFHFKTHQQTPLGGVGKRYLISEWLEPNHSEKHHELGYERWLFVAKIIITRAGQKYFRTWKWWNWSETAVSLVSVW